MNRKKETYDRYTVGERIQKRRISLGMSQEELAEQIDRATKYCSDIERGMCGMSIETMLALSESLDMSLDYMMYGRGDVASEAQSAHQKAEHLLSQCSEYQYSYAVRLLELFVESMKSTEA